MARNRRVFQAGLTTLLLLCAVVPAAGQSGRPIKKPYRSLAVMDLELDGAAPGDMEEIVDTLTQRLRETQAFRRVVSRAQREKLLQREPQAQRSRDYREDQLNRAALLDVESAVLGRLSWNGQQYQLRVQLFEVEGRKVLYEKGGVFASKGEVFAACTRLAAGIQGSAYREVPRPPADLKLGLGVGQSGVSASSGVGGGSYLYLEGLALLNRFVGIDARYALRLFPTLGGSQLVSTHLRFHVPPKKEVFVIGELGYLLSLDEQGGLSHLVGARLTPIAGGEDEFFFELLPMGLYLDTESWEAVFTLELLSIRLLFGRR